MCTKNVHPPVLKINISIGNAPCAPDKAIGVIDRICAQAVNTIATCVTTQMTIYNLGAIFATPCISV